MNPPLPPPLERWPAAGALTDIPGLSVGHWTSPLRPTGCTVVLAGRDGAVAGVAQRGGAPGTRETDLLRPENVVERVHAIVLSGGSAFGLDAASGVMQWLASNDRGLRIGPPDHRPILRVPIVPAAVLFDLWVGDGRIRPDAQAGWAACEAASRQAAAEGSVGAGAGATVGKLLGWSQAMRGGIGQASLRVEGVTVAALVAANPIGDVRDAHGRLLAGARRTPGAPGERPDGCFADLDERLRHDQLPVRVRPGEHRAGGATTIGVVATDARLTKAQTSQLAGQAHAGLARAISPLTAHDGDTLFALATGDGPAPVDLLGLGAAAAECVARAIRRAVWQADSLEHPDLPSARQWAALQAAGPEPPPHGSVSP